MSVVDNPTDKVARDFAWNTEFGDSRDASLRACAVLASGLKDLAPRHLTEELAGAVEELPYDWLCLLMRDVVLRSVTERALRRDAEGGRPDDQLQTLLYEVLDVANGMQRVDLYSGPEPLIETIREPGWIGPPAIGDRVCVLAEHLDDRQVSRVFWQMMDDLVRDRSVVATPAVQNALADALGAVHILAPELCATLFVHTRLIAVPRATSHPSSMSVPGFAGTIFVAERMLQNTYGAAEALFHEALHLKLFDLHLVGSMLSPTVQPADVPLIKAPWRRPPDMWDFTRALFAFHVYSHLVVFRRRRLAMRVHGIQEISVADQQHGVTEAGRRAHYLGTSVLKSGDGVLSDRGRRFAEWLLDSVTRLDDGTFNESPYR